MMQGRLAHGPAQESPFLIGEDGHGAPGILTLAAVRTVRRGVRPPVAHPGYLAPVYHAVQNLRHQEVNPGLHHGGVNRLALAGPQPMQDRGQDGNRKLVPGYQVRVCSPAHHQRLPVRPAQYAHHARLADYGGAIARDALPRGPERPGW